MIAIDLERGLVTVEEAGERRTYPLASPEAFAVVSRAWLRCGWDTKYVYGFTWLGRPVIQLPEDLIRVQEAIYEIKPDLVIETGVAHGGSLVFYASLLRLLGRGRVVGVDVEIRPHNRRAIEAHELSPWITLVEGDSVAPGVVARVRELVAGASRVFVVLDSGHARDHVLAELRAYAEFVTVGSYLVAADGIMTDLVGAPRTAPDWSWNNPRAAVEQFLETRRDFVRSEPPIPFNEGLVRDRVTYWSGGWLRRVAS
jgi:cephalosporin hydroxylase